MNTQQQHISKSGLQFASMQMPAAAMNGKAALPLADNRPATVMQKKMVQGMQNKAIAALPVQKKANNTGLPDQLKSGVEQLSGLSMDDVKVHYGSSKPAQVQAHAYAQGSEIHVAPGQEKHLPHEAWHVAQQKQGRVKPTKQLKSKVNINDDKGLEQEADAMGAKAMQLHADAAILATTPEARPLTVNGHTPIMRKIGFEYEVGAIKTQKDTAWLATEWHDHKKAEVIKTRTGYDVTADIDQNSGGTNLEFVTKPIDDRSMSAVADITTLANNIHADIVDIVQGSNGPLADPEGWITLNHLARVTGKKSQRMNSQVPNANNAVGQLQMTGGVDIHNLHKVLSGSALGQEPLDAHAGGAAGITKRETLSKYYSADQLGGAKQPIFHQAMEETEKRFTEGWDLPSRRIIASVCALMAQLPIEKRDENALFSNNSGMLLAKTDYATILALAADAVGIKIDATKFLNTLLGTINAFVPDDKKVSAGSDIFPADYQIIPASQHGVPQPQQQAMSFTGVTIGDWVREAMPVNVPKMHPFGMGMGMGYDPMMEMGPQEEQVKGKDLFTPKHFPGTKDQKKEMHAYGTLGEKTDPGKKIIMEWRNFGSCYPDKLGEAMLGVLQYLREA